MIIALAYGHEEYILYLAEVLDKPHGSLKLHLHRASGEQLSKNKEWAVREKQKFFRFMEPFTRLRRVKDIREIIIKMNDSVRIKRKL